MKHARRARRSRVPRIDSAAGRARHLAAATAPRARGRPRQHRDEGAPQGAGAPLHLRGRAGCGPAPVRDGPTRHRSTRHVALPHQQVRAADTRWWWRSSRAVVAARGRRSPPPMTLQAHRVSQERAIAERERLRAGRDREIPCRPVRSGRSHRSAGQAKSPRAKFLRAAPYAFSRS